MIPRTFFVFIWSSVAALFGAADRVEANDLQPAEGARADARCAAYGPGFTAVDGSDACVWVGGHVRLEVGSRMASAPENGWAASDAAAVRVKDGYDEAVPESGDATRSRERLRLRNVDAAGSLDPFR
jgi:hypothetical protein